MLNARTKKNLMPGRTGKYVKMIWHYRSPLLEVRAVKGGYTNPPVETKQIEHKSVWVRKDISANGKWQHSIAPNVFMVSSIHFRMPAQWLFEKIRRQAVPLCANLIVLRKRARAALLVILLPVPLLWKFQVINGWSHGQSMRKNATYYVS